MDTLTLLFILLAASYISGEAFRRLRLPRVLGPILVGGLLSLASGLLADENISFLRSFSDLALVFLMFYVGLELDIKSMLRKPAKAFHVSLFSIIIPFGVTFAVMKLLGYPNYIALIMGVMLSITAEAMSIDLLKELGMLRSRMGQTIIMAATFDDVVEVLFLSGLVTYVQKTLDPELSLVYMLFNILIFFTVCYSARFLFIPALMKFLHKDDSKSALFITGVLMVLMVSIAAEWLGLGALIGALMAGILVKYTLLEADEYREEKDMTELFEAVTFGFLAPFFYLWVGFKADFGGASGTIILGLVLAGLAVGTKLLGSIIGNYLARGRLREGAAIGFAMSNKGLVELVAAEIARGAGLLSQELFSAIVLMTVVTLVISSVMFRITARKLSTS